MKKLLMVAVLVLAGAAVYGQTAVSADGVIESTSGGLKFPDGTVQASAAGPGFAPVEDTGQTQCFDEDGNLRDCAGTGEDGEFQAGVTWPTPRFTDNGDGTVTDNLTGLIWLKNANCFGTRTWEQALSDANGLMSGSCALTDGSVTADWRLPNVKELLSLADYGESSPALPTGHPFTSVQSLFYWSSSSVLTNPRSAWGVGMLSGNGNAVFKFNVNYVWPVRGGQ